MNLCYLYLNGQQIQPNRTNRSQPIDNEAMKRAEQMRKELLYGENDGLKGEFIKKVINKKIPIFSFEPQRQVRKYLKKNSNKF